MIVRKRRPVARGAFTLMELLVVVAILVVLAGAGGMIYMGHLDTAKKDIAKTQTKTIAEAVKIYSIRHGGYPATLTELVQPGTDGSKPYMEATALIDPWGREYMYTNPGQHHSLTGDPDIYSMGPNASDPNGIIGDWMP
jgi:general secretion pathway protein G